MLSSQLVVHRFRLQLLASSWYLQRLVQVRQWVGPMQHRDMVEGISPATSGVMLALCRLQIVLDVCGRNLVFLIEIRSFCLPPTRKTRAVGCRL